MLLVSRCVDVDPDETLTQADASSVLTVIACNCESEHAGRPNGKLGCGRYGGLLVKLDRTPKEEDSDGSPEDPQEQNSECSGQGTQPEGKAGEQKALLRVKAEPASAGDKRWDELSDETPYNTLATARTLAEKWSATVATLLSLLGVASFLAAKDQLFKVQGPWDWLAGWHSRTLFSPCCGPGDRLCGSSRPRRPQESEGGNRRCCPPGPS